MVKECVSNDKPLNQPVNHKNHTLELSRVNHNLIRTQFRTISL